MVEITPAILSADPSELKRLLESYVDLPIGSIDIDIAEVVFVNNATVDVQTALGILEQVETGLVSIGWHLMVAKPQPLVELLHKWAEPKGIKWRIYLHQRSDLSFLAGWQIDPHVYGLVVDGSEPLPSVDSIKDWPEVQLMSIVSGKQGQEFMPEVLTKVTKLRDAGYAGKISLDGGINLEVVPQLKALADTETIDRLSVGSYLQDATDIQESYDRLVVALNYS